MANLNPLNVLPNKKTYITGLIMVAIGALSGLFPEWLPATVVVDNPSQLLLEGIGLITLRKGVAAVAGDK